MELLLPTGEDNDQHYFAANQIRQIPSYEINTDTGILRIEDGIWGECEIGHKPHDAVLIDLFLNSLVLRSAGVEQLTLPKIFTTVPGTFDFVRFEHIWGSVVLIRKKLEEMEERGERIDPREAMVLQLRTFVSDLAHTAFSHLGDWLFQGFGGAENQHDIELKELLEYAGISRILNKHGFTVDEVAFPEIEDWVECSGPDLCVDRVDFGVRERARWLTDYESTESHEKRYTIVNGQFVMRSHDDALTHGIATSLLATEHWGGPVHRYMLKKFGTYVMGIVADNGSQLAHSAEITHPRDLLFTIDSVISGYGRAMGTLNHELFEVMIGIARSQRKIAAHARMPMLQDFIRRQTSSYKLGMGDASDELVYPDPLQAYTHTERIMGVKPYNLELVIVNSPSDVPHFNEQPHTLDEFLEPLKPRFVDPLFFDENGEVKRLSEADPRYKAMLSASKELQKRAYVARLHGDPQFIEVLKAKEEIVKQRWRDNLKSPRATPDVMRRLIDDVALTAVHRAPMSIRMIKNGYTMLPYRADDTSDI